MTWVEYNQALTPLLKHFGDQYQTETIRNSFYIWKNESKEYFSNLIKESIESNIPLNLALKDNSDYYSKLLKVNGAKSALELFKNYKSFKSV